MSTPNSVNERKHPIHNFSAIHPNANLMLLGQNDTPLEMNSIRMFDWKLDTNNPSESATV